MEIKYRDDKFKRGTIYIKDETIGKVVWFELSFSQIQPPPNDPSMDIEVTEAVREYEINASRLSRTHTGKAQLIFDNANIYQAQLVQTDVEFTFKFALGLDESATGKAFIFSVEDSDELERKIEFEIVGALNINKKRRIK